jgi:NADH:ubiquinone oxidoreductase subunit H
MMGNFPEVMKEKKMFFIPCSAEINRASFDLPKAEVELAAGCNVECFSMGRKNNTCTWYRHECEPVVQMLNTAGRVVA